MTNPISKGSRVGIITPSSALSSPEDIRDGLKYLTQTLGFETVLGKYVFADNRSMGGTPEERAEDIMSFFEDKSISAIFCTRGGYGAQYILPYLDFEIVKNNPKPIIGFSDITALQMGIYSQTGNISYAGPLLKFDFENTKPNPVLEKSLQDVLAHKPQDIKGGLTVNPGIACGTLLGTNLSVLQHLAGTPYYPGLKDSVLLLEDVDAATYVFESYLLQLKQQKDFHQVKGIVFGQFTRTFIKRDGQKNIDEIITEFAKNINIPVLKDFPFGHITARPVLPLGAKCRLDASGQKLQIANI